MKKNFVLFALFAPAILLPACGGFNSLKLSSTNFTDEIDQSQNLVFTFNKDLVADSIIGKWDTAAYINFSPAVHGKFKWTSKNELTFSPFVPFSPATDYSAIITPVIMSKSKIKYAFEKNISASFHTPYLKVQATQAYWAVSERNAGNVEVRITMNFNYPVKPNELASLLHISSKGKKIDFEQLSVEPASQISVAIAPIENANKDEGIPLHLAIDKGLHCAGSSSVSKNPIEIETSIPPRGKLMVMEMTGQFVDGQGEIKINFNQPVVNDDLKSVVKIGSPMTYKVELLDGGILIKGEFQPNNSYNVILSKNLKGVFGNTLDQDYSQYVSFMEQQPILSFASDKSIYLTPEGAKNIELNISGIEKLKVTVVRIYENNIEAFMRRGDSYGYFYDDDSEEGYDYRWHDYNYYSYENYGDVVSSKIINVKSLQRDGGSSLLHLDLEQMGYNNQLKGIYIVKLEDTSRQWLQVSKFISYSDIGLIVKKSADDIFVFANSIKTSESLSGVKIRFISTNNQVVTTVTTNGDGFAHLENTEGYKPFNIGMLTARNGDDFNFMILDNTEVETSRYDVGGKNTNSSNYDCFIYGDRDIYRPGDTIHANTIIRTFDWATVKNIPVKMKLLSPNGKEFKTVKQKLDEQGAAEASFILPVSAMTGLYTLEVYSGNDVLMNYEKLSVEEFMPDRIKVVSTLNATELKPGDSLTNNITATNLYGPPAANRNYEMTLTLNRKNFNVKKFNTYNFNIEVNEEIPFESVVREGTTDGEGKAEETFSLGDYSGIGLLQGHMFSTVFDESGRPVNRLQNFTVATQDVFFGLKYTESWVDTRSQLQFPVIAVDKKGNSIGATATIQVVRNTWETVIRRSGGSYYYDSEKRSIIVSEKNISVPVGGTAFTYTPVNSGSYEIRVKSAGSDNYVCNRFWAYGWNDTQTNSFEVSNEGEVEITLNKEKYAVGEDAEVLFSTPFEGKILVTVERDKVMNFYYLNTQNKAASLKIPVTDEDLPNVYVTATAIRELKENSIPLVVARGFVPLMVEKSSNKIPVTITASESVRSKTKQTITVKSAPYSEITIAVVDEGILQLKNFLTPDPYGYFYGKRALEVSDYDLYPYIFPELSNSKSSTGGDMAEMSKRLNPVTAKRVTLMAKWSGILKTDANGIAKYTFDIPQFNGSLRIMAVSYKDKSFGSSEKIMKVADPVVITTSLPRFASPGDTLTVPVTLANTTKTNSSATATISVTGPLQLVGMTKISSTLKPNAEQQVIFKIVAKKEIGVASVTVSVSGLNETFTDKTEIGVRPSSPLQKKTDAGVIKGGESISINLNSDFITSSANAKLIISKSPLVQFSKNLSYLIQYPYGCVEQTTSTAFPQIYFSDITKALGETKLATRYNPNYNVQQAINKLLSMQLYDGALSYWLGGDYESWWGSVYAAHFLFEARKAGYDVDKNVLDRLMGYIQAKNKSYETETYWYYSSTNNLEYRLIASEEIIYGMYVLALYGKYDYTTMNYYKANSSLLSVSEKYLLATTYALAGNNISYLSILPKVYAGEWAINSFDGSYYSGIRDEALALNALIEVEPDNAQVGIMAKHLSQELKNRDWLNTQEAAFSFLALGKIARRSTLSNATANVTVNGISVGNFSGEDLVIKTGIVNQNVKVNVSGTGSLYYFWEMEGISKSGTFKPEDKYMQVRKTFLDRNGKPIYGNTFSQNDLVVVKITVQSVDYKNNIENVAITDLLPAGFEIENPRVGAVPELSWIKDNTTPDYLDIRDDRINFFTTVYHEPKNFYYVVRAVSKGKFVLGPVSADAMYNADYHSINGGGFVTVK